MNTWLKEIKKELDNIMTAIKQGIYSPTIKSTLDNLAEEKANLELAATKEQIERPKLSKEQIRHWIEKFRLIDKDDLTQRQQLIDVFVNAVYVYDDKLLITYNYKDGDKCISYEEIQEYMNKKENSDSLNDYQSSPLSLCGVGVLTEPCKIWLKQRVLGSQRTVTTKYFLPKHHEKEKSWCFFITQKEEITMSVSLNLSTAFLFFVLIYPR